MQFISDNSAARAAITTFLIAGASSMSSDDRLKLNELGNSASIADAVVNAGEFLYARKASLPKAGKILGAQLMAFRAANDWHRDSDNTNTRALTLRDAFMRDANETAMPGQTYGAKADDPAPLDAYKDEPATTADPAPVPAPAA